MKRTRSSPKQTAKESDVAQAVGGQPENDQDARAAGLKSATSAGGAEKSHRTVKSGKKS